MTAEPVQSRQAQRSADMRERLIDATIRVLIAQGYARASTWAICAESGVSRGGMLHHFPTRISLFEAAIARLALGPLHELDAALAAAKPNEAVDLYLDWLWRTLDGPLFAVGLELLNAARTEPDLLRLLRDGRNQLSTLLNNAALRVAALAGHSADSDLATALQLSSPLVRGIGLELLAEADRAAFAASFTRWRALVQRLATKA